MINDILTNLWIYVVNGDMFHKRKVLCCSIISIGKTSAYVVQGCISCGILVSGIGARGVSSEHMENMEMFSCSPT